MKQVIDIGLPPLKQPFSWAVKASGSMLFTAHGPVRKDGSIDTGAIEAQARLTFSNLRMTLEAAGGTLEDVTQVLIYMTDVADMPAIDNVYREFFVAPYPNRSSAAVAALVVPGMKLEIVAYAMLAPPPG
jgi:2-iminobutanoate/2-iminopropanoate deaminase